MKGDTSIEERIREELQRMRAEVRTERIVPRAVLGRARRAMITTLAGSVLLTAAIVTVGIAAWHTFGSATPGPSIVPATRGSSASPTPPATTPSRVSGALLSRPLALPVVPAGALCPATPTTKVSPGPGTGFTGSNFLAQRAGHIYVVGGSKIVRLRPQSRTADGWYAIKDIWVTDPSYSGPVLIRGGRLDGVGGLDLAWDPMTPRRKALLIDSSSMAVGPTGWRSVPTVAYVRSPGCYAYQLDGIGFTEFIVFEAIR